MQVTVKNLRESTGQLWENTRQRTRGLGNALNRSLEKIKREKNHGDNPGKEAVPGPKDEDIIDIPKG
ncbi:MAG: hypothetical protein BWY80_01288 [Firmicutes bacterium ADurb.Bin456]|nr:MAG: hypothetical protein BWY80_01288 [Firmicutes bacterium ADurb.Bin456]